MAPGPGFDLAVVLLFAVPGPTNALIAVAGARRGARALPALVGAALVGFVAAVAGLIGFAGPYVAATPALGRRYAPHALCCWRARRGFCGDRPAQAARRAVRPASPPCWRRRWSIPRR